MSKIKKTVSNLMFMYKQIYSISKMRFYLIVLLCVVSTLNTLIDIYFLKYIIDGLMLGMGYAYFFVVISVKLCALLLNQCCENVLYNYIFRKNDIVIQKELTLRLFNNIKKIKLAKIEDPEYYDRYQKAIAEVTNRSSALLGFFSFVISTFLNIVSLAVVISTLDLTLICISIIGMLITVWANIINTKNVYNADMSFVPVDRKVDYIRRVFYLPQYAKDIRRTRLPELLSESYNSAVEEKFYLIKKHWPRIIVVAISGSWLYNVVNVGVSYFYLAVKCLNNIVSIGDITALASSINQLSNNLLQISNIIPQATQYSMLIQNYRDMIDDTCIEYRYQEQGKISISDIGDIKINHVSFAYPFSETYAINDVSLFIKKGERIAIVGENGSGKTTLLKLLSALYDPSLGDISINGIDYSNISFESISKQMGIVDQDFQHYAFTISENIALQGFDKKVDDDMIAYTLEKVKMNETVSNLKKGYNSFYSKEFDIDGVDFSGGQLQRLAIARALYSDASLLILDEPSSALDPINEQLMYDMFFDISKGKTLVIVSHRLSCVKDVDKIVVMEKGKIIEIGNHTELMKKNGKYAEMFRLQGDRYGIENT